MTKRPTIEELEEILSGKAGKWEIQFNPDGSLTTKPMNTSVVDAAVELCAFCRMNGYPKEMTPEFQKLTELVDRLDTALRRGGLIAQNLTPTRTEPPNDRTKLRR
jgi:hypothetical protein